MSQLKGFADLADLPEDERIRIVAEMVKCGNTVAVAIDDEPEKIARYIRKLQAAGVRVLDTVDGLVPHTKTIRVGPKES